MMSSDTVSIFYFFAMPNHIPKQLLYIFFQKYKKVNYLSGVYEFMKEPVICNESTWPIPLVARIMFYSIKRSYLSRTWMLCSMCRYSSRA